MIPHLIFTQLSSIACPETGTLNLRRVRPKNPTFTVKLHACQRYTVPEVVQCMRHLFRVDRTLLYSRNTMGRTDAKASYYTHLESITQKTMTNLPRPRCHTLACRAWLSQNRNTRVAGGYHLAMSRPRRSSSRVHTQVQVVQVQRPQLQPKRSETRAVISSRAWPTQLNDELAQRAWSLDDPSSRS